MLGKSIKRLREERQITQRQLAYALNISTQAVSKWERGCGYPDISFLLPLADYFGVSLDELFGRVKEEDPSQNCL